MLCVDLLDLLRGHSHSYVVICSTSPNLHAIFTMWRHFCKTLTKSHAVLYMQYVDGRGQIYIHPLGVGCNTCCTFRSGVAQRMPLLFYECHKCHEDIALGAPRKTCFACRVASGRKEYTPYPSSLP